MRALRTTSHGLRALLATSPPGERVRRMPRPAGCVCRMPRSFFKSLIFFVASLFRSTFALRMCVGSPFEIPAVLFFSPVMWFQEGMRALWTTSYGLRALLATSPPGERVCCMPRPVGCVRRVPRPLFLFLLFFSSLFSFPLPVISFRI